ncbi:MAG: hypothetical protein ACRYFX_18675 [Janthinobacterium lividum]
MKTPDTLTPRPQAHGLPVPYFVAPAQGAPDFRLLDGNRLRVCLQYGKCSICAGLLRGDTYLVVGPLALQNRIDGHAPAHLACAQYALANCPYLSFERTERRTDYPAEAVKLAGSVDEKPTAFFLVQVDRVQFLAAHHLTNFRPVRALPYHYVGGRLVEAADGWQAIRRGAPWRQEGGVPV